MQRRTFLQLSAGGLLFGATGCGREDRQQAAKAAKVAAAGAGLVALVFPLARPHLRILGLALRATAALLTCDCLWQDGTDQKCEQVSYRPTQDEAGQIARKVPVAIQNAAHEDLNDRVLLGDRNTLVLANYPQLFELRYRCVGVQRLTMPTVRAPHSMAVLQMLLGTQWRVFHRNGLSTFEYGNTVVWQSWFTPLEQQVRIWERELKISKFEVEVHAPDGSRL